ncbi:MAG: winged helix-turn-helix transcriptional regulator [Phycisphaerales bacterium]|nr:winged helix-turn-helix transcriptional regulator [Phycisphaerales bacterium]
MASVFKSQPATPRQATRRRGKIDGVLDPEVFKALSDPNRLRILACLVKCGRPCSVTEVAACCSIDFSMVARHLGALARAGLLESTKEGRTVWYEAPSGALAARFRAIAEAIEEWPSSRCCGSSCDPGACGGGS